MFRDMWSAASAYREIWFKLQNMDFLHTEVVRIEKFWRTVPEISSRKPADNSRRRLRV
jgi:hypothetical protein